LNKLILKLLKLNFYALV